MSTNQGNRHSQEGNGRTSSAQPLLDYYHGRPLAAGLLEGAKPGSEIWVSPLAWILFGSVEESITTNYVAEWDGEQWNPLGSGTSGPVFAMALDGNQLFVGGRFHAAGGRISSHVARVSLDGLSPVERVRSHSVLHLRGLQGGRYALQQSTNLRDWETISVPLPAVNGAIDYSVSHPVPLRAFYRAAPGTNP